MGSRYYHVHFLLIYLARYLTHSKCPINLKWMNKLNLFSFCTDKISWQWLMHSSTFCHFMNEINSQGHVLTPLKGALILLKTVCCGCRKSQRRWRRQETLNIHLFKAVLWYENIIPYETLLFWVWLYEVLSNRR